MLSHLPLDPFWTQAESPVRVCVIAFDTVLHFFRSSSSEVECLVVSDTSKVFVPELEGLLIRTSEFSSRLTPLLTRLPAMFEHNQATEAGGLVAAIEAGTEILRQAASPGKLFVLNASVIPQCSSKRNEQRALGTNKEKTVLAPGSRVFTDLGLKCIEVGCSVELFLFPNQFMDVSTLAEVCCVSSGHVHLYWAFGLEDDDDAVLLSDLRRTIARQTAVLRVRTSCVAR